MFDRRDTLAPHLLLLICKRNDDVDSQCLSVATLRTNVQLNCPFHPVSVQLKMWRQRRQCVHAGDTFLLLRFIPFFFLILFYQVKIFCWKLKKNKQKKIVQLVFLHMNFLTFYSRMCTTTYSFKNWTFCLSDLRSLCLSDDLSDLVQPPASLFLLIEQTEITL